MGQGETAAACPSQSGAPRDSSSRARAARVPPALRPSSIASACEGRRWSHSARRLARSSKAAPSASRRAPSSVPRMPPWRERARRRPARIGRVHAAFST